MNETKLPINLCENVSGAFIHYKNSGSMDRTLIKMKFKKERDPVDFEFINNLKAKVQKDHDRQTNSPLLKYKQRIQERREFNRISMEEASQNINELEEGEYEKPDARDEIYQGS